MLIQQIGYEKICQELQAVSIDSWQEYKLIKIDADVDEEQIYLLKMNCPSTGKIHALLVGPDLQTAREAIGWINWGIQKKLPCRFKLLKKFVVALKRKPRATTEHDISRGF